MFLLLYSEHLMRRIACESDFEGEGGGELVEIYNDGLGKGLMSDALDAVYEPGSAESLG